MAATTDGFRIAEEDLRLRGPGELLGQQQSGLPALRFGDLVRDREWIELARTAAREVTRRETETRPQDTRPSPTTPRPGAPPADVTRR
jgi:ATP-dependent DNA helicase RecG